MKALLLFFYGFGMIYLTDIGYLIVVHKKQLSNNQYMSNMSYRSHVNSKPAVILSVTYITSLKGWISTI